MSDALKLSVLGNLILAAVVVCFAFSYWPAKKTAAGGRLISGTVVEETARAFSVSPKPAQSKPERFLWSEIESPDYRRYIANLRSISCPEQTIRDIIVADVHNLYAPDCSQLEEIVGVLENSACCIAARQACKKELQRLSREETA